ncbi:MAG: TetR/AcrR family transcriptional regulator [Candidatus Fermentibacter sp.]|nr:MAG: hypothetical protein AO394_09765 [Candidatus Fermentibacter daniensis]MBP7720670.1 TetR/AcrR family transcriptional regulator [Candidatus Fermentibacter sp.]
MGLMEENKSRRMARVMSSIRSFLARNPIEDLTMDGIAAASRISVGTLYNYYGSKEMMLVAYCRDRMQECFAAARRLVENPPESAEAAYFELLSIYLRGFGALERPLVGSMIRILIVNQARGTGVAGFQRNAFDQLRVLTRKLKDSGTLPTSAREDSIAFVLFGICSDLLFQFSLCNEVDIETQVSLLGQCINLIYTGLAAREDTPPGLRGTNT